MQPEIFQGIGGFAEPGHFDKYFAKKTQEKGPSGKHLGVFILDTLKTKPWIENVYF